VAGDELCARLLPEILAFKIDTPDFNLEVDRYTLATESGCFFVLRLGVQ